MRLPGVGAAGRRPRRAARGQGRGRGRRRCVPGLHGRAWPRPMVRGWGEVLAVEIGSAGGARAAGVRAYLARHDRALESTWLASTDADTVVPETWIDHQLGLARLGVAGVAGIVAVDSFTDHPAHVPARWAGLYDGPLDDPHPHIHGANLGSAGRRLPRGRRLGGARAGRGPPAVGRAAGRRLPGRLASVARRDDERARRTAGSAGASPTP